MGPRLVPISRAVRSSRSTSPPHRAAGVTEPILYRHFKSKQELFVAIVKSVSNQTMKHWESIIAGVNDPADQIRRVASSMPGHMDQLSDAYHVLHGALSTSRDKKVLA